MSRIIKNTYGTSHTIGARQVAILLSMFGQTSMTIPEIQTLHPTNIRQAMSTLRLRGLVRRRTGRFSLTKQGQEIAERAKAARVPAGMGLCSAAPTKREG